MAYVSTHNKQDKREAAVGGEVWPRWAGTYMHARFGIQVIDKKTYDRAELVLDDDEITEVINEIVRWKLGRQLITQALNEHPQFANECMDTTSGHELLYRTLLPALYVAMDHHLHSMDMPMIPQRNSIVLALEDLLKNLKETEETLK